MEATWKHPRVSSPLLSQANAHCYIWYIKLMHDRTSCYFTMLCLFFGMWVPALPLSSPSSCAYGRLPYCIMNTWGNLSEYSQSLCHTFQDYFNKTWKASWERPSNPTTAMSCEGWSDPDQATAMLNIEIRNSYAKQPHIQYIFFIITRTFQTFWIFPTKNILILL